MTWTFECFETGGKDCKDLQWNSITENGNGLTTNMTCGIRKPLGEGAQGAQAPCQKQNGQVLCQVKLGGCAVYPQDSPAICTACSKGATPSCVLPDDKAAFTKQCDQEKKDMKGWVQKKWEGELLSPLEVSTDYGRWWLRKVV